MRTHNRFFTVRSVHPNISLGEGGTPGLTFYSFKNRKLPQSDNRICQVKETAAKMTSPSGFLCVIRLTHLAREKQDRADFPQTSESRSQPCPNICYGGSEIKAQN